MTDTPTRVLCIPHGGGPMPVLGEPSHQRMVDFLMSTESSIGRPGAIIVVSAHWECQRPTVTVGEEPGLIYDYGGFPEETYRLTYPAPGAPDLARRTAELLGAAGFDPELDEQRGHDHGVFIPLLLMYPEATIPVIQLSLLSSLDPAAHIAMGAALAPLADSNVLILGSGFTFHNMGAFNLSNPTAEVDPENEAFEAWLHDTCTSTEYSEERRAALLTDWAAAPGARWAHPREEHLLPLHVCYGAGGGPGTRVFNDLVLGKRASGYAW